MLMAMAATSSAFLLVMLTGEKSLGLPTAPLSPLLDELPPPQAERANSNEAVNAKGVNKRMYHTPNKRLIRPDYELKTEP